MQNLGQQFLSFNQAIQYLDVSKSFLYKLTSQGRITFYKPSGKLIYFKISDLNNWIQQNEILSTASIQDQCSTYLNRLSHGE